MEAQFQTALDRLIETPSAIPDNESILTESTKTFAKPLPEVDTAGRRGGNNANDSQIEKTLLECRASIPHHNADQDQNHKQKEEFTLACIDNSQQTASTSDDTHNRNFHQNGYSLKNSFSLKNEQCQASRTSRILHKGKLQR